MNRPSVAKIQSFLWAALLVMCPLGAQGSEVSVPLKTEDKYPTDGQSYDIDHYASPVDGHKVSPALLFFHGGGWSAGGRLQFERQAMRLINQTNLIIFSAEYPTTRNPIESTRAAQAAVCWIKKNAAKLGVDSGRIALSGASAGGQLAVAAVLAESGDVSECNDVAKPYAKALILFSPVLDLKDKWESRFGMSLRDVSPIDLLNSPLPPTIIFQGSADTITTLQDAKRFVNKARSLGSQEIELQVFEGREHGFFNRQDFDSTMDLTVRFLTNLGWQ